jgi:3-dehydroquinate synthetase
MQAAAHIARRLDLLSSEDAERQTDLLRELGLPLAWRANADEVLSRLALDKKRAGNRQRWVLAERVGAARIRDDVPHELAHEAVALVTRA